MNWSEVSLHPLVREKTRKPFVSPHQPHKPQPNAVAHTLEHRMHPNRPVGEWVEFQWAVHTCRHISPAAAEAGCQPQPCPPPPLQNLPPPSSPSGVGTPLEPPQPPIPGEGHVASKSPLPLGGPVHGRQPPPGGTGPQAQAPLGPALDAPLSSQGRIVVYNFLWCVGRLCQESLRSVTSPEQTSHRVGVARIQICVSQSSHSR